MKLPKKLENFSNLPLIEQWRAFANWCAKQKITDGYDYLSTKNCAKSQFVKSLIGKRSDLKVHTGGPAKVNFDRHIICMVLNDPIGYWDYETTIMEYSNLKELGINLQKKLGIA